MRAPSKLIAPRTAGATIFTRGALAMACAAFSAAWVWATAGGAPAAGPPSGGVACASGFSGLTVSVCVVCAGGCGR